jgi:ribonuclease-3
LSHRRNILHVLQQFLTSRLPFLNLPGTGDGSSDDQNAVEQFYARQVQINIAYQFIDTSHLILALKHRSYVYAHEQTGILSNERLEFLGDAVLDLVVSDQIYKIYPKRREGRLTQLRSLLVNKSSLAQEARSIKLGKYLLLSESEARTGGRHRDSILADAYESIIGAMYLDGGIEPVRNFLERTLLANVEKHTKSDLWRNYKSALLEYTQGSGKGQPKYRVEAEIGPDHDKTFTVEVYITGTSVGRGAGSSKKDAEQDAARDAAERLQLFFIE